MLIVPNISSDRPCQHTMSSTDLSECCIIPLKCSRIFAYTMVVVQFMGEVNKVPQLAKQEIAVIYHVYMYLFSYNLNGIGLHSLLVLNKRQNSSN